LENKFSLYVVNSAILILCSKFGFAVFVPKSGFGGLLYALSLIFVTAFASIFLFKFGEAWGGSWEGIY